MQDLPIYKQIVISLNEVFDKRRFCAITFALISISIVLVGLRWPKTFESTTTLLWDTSQVIKPLLEGTAITNTGIEQQQIAREVIFSNKNLETLIQKAELNVDARGNEMSDRDIEILKSELRSKIVIQKGKNGILGISHKNPSAEEAYLVVSIISKLFIEEITQNKKDESFKAYQFIQSQVDDYQKKLNQINENIIDFKSKNLEVQVDSTQGVNNRIGVLNGQIEAATLELREATIQRDSLLEQLLIESQKSTAREVVQVRNERLVNLENQLSQLRLSYTDTYPDIVQIMEQIKYLKENIEQYSSQEESQAGPGDDSDTGLIRSELYNILKRQVADQETTIKTLQARKSDLEGRFEQEIERSSEVNFVFSKLEELSRDQKVTKQLYDKLLIKLENARVSLNLELESAGSLFKVQEPPIIPLVPQGLRFLHFAIASLVLGLGIPIGGIIGILLIDPRLRDGDSLDSSDDLPVLGQVPSYKTPAESRHDKFVTVQSISIFSLSLMIVSGTSLMRFYEMI